MPDPVSPACRHCSVSKKSVAKTETVASDWTRGVRIAKADMLVEGYEHGGRNVARA